MLLFIPELLGQGIGKNKIIQCFVIRIQDIVFAPFRRMPNAPTVDATPVLSRGQRLVRALSLPGCRAQSVRSPAIRSSNARGDRLRPVGARRGSEMQTPGGPAEGQPQSVGVAVEPSEATVASSSPMHGLILRRTARPFPE